MNDMKSTIRDYEDTRKGLKIRIDELNREINEAAKKGGVLYKHLLGRRYTLYMELWNVDDALRQMKEYVALQDAKALAG